MTSPGPARELAIQTRLVGSAPRPSGPTGRPCVHGCRQEDDTVRTPSRRTRTSPRLRRVTAAFLSLATVLLASGCVQNAEQSTVEQPNAPQNYLEPIGRFAVETDQLWDIVLVVSTVVFVLVQGLIIVAILRFREKPEDADRLPKQVHGNPRLEALWTVIPAVILAVVAVPTVRTLFDLAEEPAEALSIDVVGHQWWWEYEYGGEYEGLVTANELHIPTGETVVLKATSEDVIHSFWAPKLAGKQDAVPGRTTLIKLHTDEPGEYLGQCAEYCGLSHANMRLRVIAHEPAEFREWAQAHAQPYDNPRVSDAVAAGKAQFAAKGCVGCHAIRGYALTRADAEAGGLDEQQIANLFGDSEELQATATVGPDLTYFSDRDWFAGAIFENNDENLHDWLQDPPAMKPMAPGSIAGMPDLGLTDQEISDLIAFLRTLSTSG